MNVPSATADGKQIAFLQTSSSHSPYLADLAAGGTRVVNVRPLSSGSGSVDQIQDWTNDSKTLISALNGSDHNTFRKQPLNSDEQETLLSSTVGWNEMAEMSPDGKWMIA